mgnify:CR=1 FL=1
MLKKTVTYTDFDGLERTEDIFFNLSKAEIMKMQLSVDGGLDAKIQKIIKNKDIPALTAVFTDLLSKAYGIKSDDGKRFIKSKELTEEFEQTEAYSQIFMELLTDDKAAAEFINGIIPNDLAKELAKAEKNGTLVPSIEGK